MANHEKRFSVLPERMPAPPLEQLNEAQKKVAADLIATRGKLQGPFMATIRSPKLADRMQQLNYDLPADPEAWAGVVERIVRQYAEVVQQLGFKPQ